MYPGPIGMGAGMCLGGRGIARGYLDQADLTAEKFVPCPIGSNAGERIYRTGDLARYQPDGTIEYVGRLDQQVKVRGYRIELGEIEEALLHYPGTKEVAVSLWQDPSHNKKLVAYIVVDDAKQISTDELRHYLQENLPAYMVPAIFVPLPQLPRLLNGKLDQAALPAPSLQEPKDIPAPRTALEQALVALWTEVLQTPQIGLRDNFFELGGDSILSLQMVARGKQRGLHFTSKQLFQHQTIEQLSRTVEVGTHVLAEQGPVVGTVPLTPIQHWFFELHLSAPHHWNQALFLQVGEQIGGGFLQEVVAVWLRQHDVLRLRFVPEQVLADPNTHTLPLVIIDLQHLSHSEQDLTATRLAQETQASLNLREGPLLRVILFDRGRGRTRLLLIVIHHLAVDGVSWRILLEDLQIASTQRVLGEPIKLPAKTSSFKTWAEHLVQYARSDAIREEQSYWLARTLEQTSPLPLDDPSHGRQSTVAATAVVSRTLTEEETLALLSRVPAIYHTQMNEVLLTALAWTLVQWTDEPAVLIDLEGHGRQDLFVGVDVSRTVGWFTSVFPLRLDLKGIKNVKDALTVVKEQVRAVPHHGIGYGILRYLSTDRIL